MKWICHASKDSSFRYVNKQMQRSGDGREFCRIVWSTFLQFHVGVVDHFGGEIFDNDADGVAVFNII